MEITTISYGLTRNLGNYQSARLVMEAQVQEGEDWKESLCQLKGLVADQIGYDNHDLISLSDLDSSIKSGLLALSEEIAEKKQQLSTLEGEARQLDREIQKLRYFRDSVVANSGALKNDLDRILKTWEEINPSQAEENLKRSVAGDFPEHEYEPIEDDYIKGF